MEAPQFDIFSLDLIPAVVPVIELPVEAVEEAYPEVIPKPEKIEDEPEPEHAPEENQNEENNEENEGNGENEDNGENEGNGENNENPNPDEGDDEDDEDEPAPQNPGEVPVSALELIEERLNRSPSVYKGVMFKILECLVCPISQDLPKQPVIGSDGNTYDAECIKKWLQKHETSPITREKLRKRQVQNRAVRNIIEILKGAEMDWIDGPTALHPEVRHRMHLLRAERYLRLREKSNGSHTLTTTKYHVYNLEMDATSSTLDDLILAFGHVAHVPPEVELQFKYQDTLITRENWDTMCKREVFALVE